MGEVVRNVRPRHVLVVRQDRNPHEAGAAGRPASRRDWCARARTRLAHCRMLDFASHTVKGQRMMAH